LGARDAATVTMRAPPASSRAWRDAGPYDFKLSVQVWTIGRRVPTEAVACVALRLSYG
jgi:hypothetical protein